MAASSEVRVWEMVLRHLTLAGTTASTLKSARQGMKPLNQMIYATSGSGSRSTTKRAMLEPGSLHCAPQHFQVPRRNVRGHIIEHSEVCCRFCSGPCNFCCRCCLRRCCCCCCRCCCCWCSCWCCCLLSLLQFLWLLRSLSSSRLLVFVLVLVGAGVGVVDVLLLLLLLLLLLAGGAYAAAKGASISGLQCARTRVLARFSLDKKICDSDFASIFTVP